MSEYIADDLEGSSADFNEEKSGEENSNEES